jgi:hypothetical protein|tara:strand:- start:2602 stop:3276 length:675 start_codon:yes stop_codon:yes gene_type:complete
MGLRRQVYEWRNIVQNVGDNVFLNGYPISSVGSCVTAALSANQPIDIFIGDIGNNLDMPGRLKAYQFVVLDAIGLWPQTMSAQLYVNTTKYFQDPDRVPSRTGGISANIVPFPNGQDGILNFDYKEGLKPPLYILPGQNWGVEVTSSIDVAASYTTLETEIAKCFIKYLLIDGADCLVAQHLVKSGWALTVENIWKFKQDIIKSHLYAGMTELPEEITEAKRKV